MSSVRPSVCLSVTLCIVALRDAVQGQKWHQRVPSRQVPICPLRHFRCMYHLATKRTGIQDATLSQGEPRDAAISFDTTASCMRLLWHSMDFLYRPTSATVQMLKLHHTVGLR